MLEVRKVSKAFRHNLVLREVGFRLEPGQCLGVAGHNGSGKTTLLSIIARTLSADGGEILFDGVSLISDRALAGDIIGYVPQENGLLEDLTVNETLAFWQKAYGLPAGSIYAPSSPAVMLGLEEIRKKRIARLSGGMQKRVSIAVALLRRPRLLLLDEALAALDRGYRLALERYLDAFCRQGGGVIYCSHDINELRSFCRRILVLRDGSKVFDGDTELFPSDPAELDILLNPESRTSTISPEQVGR